MVAQMWWFGSVGRLRHKPTAWCSQVSRMAMRSSTHSSMRSRLPLSVFDRSRAARNDIALAV